MSAGLRDEILGALACVQGALRSDEVHGQAVVQLSAAVSALNRAADMLHQPPPNVVPFPGYSVRV